MVKLTAVMRRPWQGALLTLALCGAGVHAQDNEAPTQGQALDEPADQQAVLPLDDLRTFAKVYNHIRSGYVEDVSDKTLLEYAIKGMLAELDPHSAYLDSSTYEDLQVNTTGEFGGLGIEVGMEKGFIKVIAPIDDTPAARAGLQSGDLIVELDNKPVKGMNIREAVDKMRGPIGSTIDLTIVREGLDKPLEVTLERDTIKVTSVRSRLLEPGYGYVRIAQFQVDTGAEVRQAVETLQADNPDLKGLVIDLRNNPGGVLKSSVDVADVFLDGGRVVYTKGRIQNADLDYMAEEGDALNGLPIVVLINDGSASASEIVAGALQDHRRAIIVGTDSFGKGSVQTVIPISEERAIKLTTALYFTPNGRSIQAQGIAPDIFVERARVTAIKPQLRATEADLDNHLNNANGAEENGSAAREAEESEQASLVERDNQLYEALNLLKGIHVFGLKDKLASPSMAQSEEDLAKPAADEAQ